MPFYYHNNEQREIITEMFPNVWPVTKEKWVTLPNENLSLMTLLDADIEMLSKRNDKKSRGNFEIGGIYSLGREGIEGVEFGKLYFMVHGIVSEYKGCNLNSLIVREIAINEDGSLTDNANASGRKKFSVPPSMCKLLGIKYSPGYELWPMNSGFEKVTIKEKVDINYADMATYPVSSIDGTIRKIILSLNGFSTFNSLHIITPTGAMLKTNDFIHSLTVYTKSNISTDKGCAGFRLGTKLPFKIVGRANDSGIVSICDDKHNIYLEVDLTIKSDNVNTADGRIGVSKTSLVGKDVDDIIEIKWDECKDENATAGKQNDFGKELNTTLGNIDDVARRVFGLLDRHFLSNNIIQTWK